MTLQLTAPACGQASLVATHRPLWQRWRLDLLAAWENWRERVRCENEWRALEALSDSTLRDIGLAERLLPRETLPLVDYERGRW